MVWIWKKICKYQLLWETWHREYTYQCVASMGVFTCNLRYSGARGESSQDVCVCVCWPFWDTMNTFIILINIVHTHVKAQTEHFKCVWFTVHQLCLNETGTLFSNLFYFLPHFNCKPHTCCYGYSESMGAWGWGLFVFTTVQDFKVHVLVSFLLLW